MKINLNRIAPIFLGVLILAQLFATNASAVETESGGLEQCYKDCHLSHLAEKLDCGEALSDCYEDVGKYWVPWWGDALFGIQETEILTCETLFSTCETIASTNAITCRTMCLREDTRKIKQRLKRSLYKEQRSSSRLRAKTQDQMSGEVYQRQTEQIQPFYE